jgi:(p)ppGpp synthase/HD superfamily hydrolase
MDPKFDKALALAIDAHGKQTRKGSDTPFLVHPLSVALLLAKLGVHDDIIIAGILHDILEDTDVTIDYLASECSTLTVFLVDEVTTENPEEPWASRKIETAEKIRYMTTAGAIIKACDLLHNMRSLHMYNLRDGEKVWDSFTANKELEHWAFSQYYWALTKRLKEEEADFYNIVVECGELIESIFGSIYKRTNTPPHS